MSFFSELQRHARGIVDQAYSDNQDKAKLMVERPIDLLGGLNSLAVAGLANARVRSNLFEPVLFTAGPGLGR